MDPLNALSFKTEDRPSSLSSAQLPDRLARTRKISLEALKNLHQTREAEPCKFSGTGFIILFTGDTHSYLEPSIASFVSDKALGGIVRRIHYLEQVRSLSNRPVLVLDGGDFLEGTPIFEKFGGQAEAELMNLASYDAATVGNHDFCRGLAHLQRLLKIGNLDAVCANIHHEESSELCFAPYQLFEIAGRLAAVVGVMGTDAWQSIKPFQRKGLELKAPLEALDHILPEIRANADVIILLSHAGIKEDRELAKHPMVDIVIGAHSHTLMKEQEIVVAEIGGREKRTPVFHSFRHGMFVGRVDVEFEEARFLTTSSSVQYLDEQFNPPPDNRYPVIEKAVKLLDAYRDKMESFKVVLGQCVEPLLAKDKMQGPVELGMQISEVFKQSAEADVGVIPSGSIKLGIEKGPFTVGSLHGMLAHEEPLWVLDVTGSLLLSLMQKNEERWGKARSFQYAGVSLVKEQEEIKSLSVGGKALQMDGFYSISGPSFFFEREFMDQNKNILPEYAGQIKCVKEKHGDLRIIFAEYVKAKGLGRWIRPESGFDIIVN